MIQQGASHPSWVTDGGEPSHPMAARVFESNRVGNHFSEADDGQVHLLGNY